MGNNEIIHMYTNINSFLLPIKLCWNFNLLHFSLIRNFRFKNLDTLVIQLFKELYSAFACMYVCIYYLSKGWRNPMKAIIFVKVNICISSAGCPVFCSLLANLPSTVLTFSVSNTYYTSVGLNTRVPPSSVKASMFP